MKCALTIAGSDSCGGAGIQADIKTMTMNGVYAMSVITALTAQNTTGVFDILEVSPQFLQAQMDAVFTDMSVDAIKIGMVSNPDLIEMICECLIKYHARNVVVDPVMVATSGARLMKEDAYQVLTSKLFPLATLITPNILEAQVLCGFKINNRQEMEKACVYIGTQYGCNVLLKGGHSIEDASDLLYEQGILTWFEGTRIENSNTHGTGCTLSSAIASNLAKGYSLKEAIGFAKEYISGALSAQLDLGKGSGPLQHNFDLQSKFAK